MPTLLASFTEVVEEVVVGACHLAAAVVVPPYLALVEVALVVHLL